MTGSTVQALIDELADELQRSVVVNDPGVVMLYASRHFGDEDAVRTHALLQRRAAGAAIGHVLAQGVTGWTAPGVVPASPDIGMDARVCVPVRHHGELLGLMLVVDRDATLTTGELGRMVAAAEQVGALLAGERGAEDAGAARVVVLLAALDPRADVRSGAAARLADEAHLPGPHLRAVSLEPRPGTAPGPLLTAALRAATGTPSRRGAPRQLGVVADDRAVVLLGSPRPLAADRAVAAATRMVTGADEVGVGRLGFVAGVGGAVEGPDEAWVSLSQARLAARAALLGRRPGPVAAWDDLGADALLVRLPLDDVGPETLPDGLRRLLAADRDGRLRETLTAFLDRAGSVPATAQALSIHRTTLYYRLERIAELGGVDLDDGETRLALHLGLRVLARLPAPRRFDN